MSHIIVKLKVKQETNMSSAEIGRLIKEVSTSPRESPRNDRLTHDPTFYI